MNDNDVTQEFKRDERVCVECGHERTFFLGGKCRAPIPSPETLPQRCLCRCTFPDTKQENERVCVGGSDGSASCGHEITDCEKKQHYYTCWRYDKARNQYCHHKCTFPDTEQGERVERRECQPYHRFNGGRGATLCVVCSTIITEGLTDDLYCTEHAPAEPPRIADPDIQDALDHYIARIGEEKDSGN